MARNPRTTTCKLPVPSALNDDLSYKEVSMKIIKVLAITVLSLLATYGVISIILLMLGYKYTISVASRPDWEAIGAVGGYAAVLVAIVVPIGVVYIENQFKKSIKESEKRNQEKFDILNDTQEKVMSEITTFRQEYENGKTWLCPHCKQVTEHSGIMCTRCGYRDCE